MRSIASIKGMEWSMVWSLNDRPSQWEALTIRKLVSRLGLEPRALALKGLIKLLRLVEIDSDGMREFPRLDE